MTSMPRSSALQHSTMFWPSRHCLRRALSSAFRLPRWEMLMVLWSATAPPVMPAGSSGLSVIAYSFLFAQAGTIIGCHAA